jgi:hypothetical protein
MLFGNTVYVHCCYFVSSLKEWGVSCSKLISIFVRVLLVQIKRELRHCTVHSTYSMFVLSCL